MMKIITFSIANCFNTSLPLFKQGAIIVVLLFKAGHDRVSILDHNIIIIDSFE